MDTPNLSPKELAFVLGYLSHAAADTFAHTFVNRYAGDVFEAFKHPLAATRHIYIEGFVSNHLPPIFAPSLGAPRDAANLLREGGKINFPERLIRDRMLLNGEAARQFERGGATHLSLAHGLYRDLENLIQKGGPLDDLQAKVKDFVAELVLQIPIDDRISKELNRLQNELDDRLNQVAADLKPILDQLKNDLTKIEGLPDDLAEKSLMGAVDLVAEIAKLHSSLEDWKSKVRERGIGVINAKREVEDRITDRVEDLCKVFVPWACALIKELKENVRAAENSLIEAEEEVSRIIPNAIATNKEKLKKAISSGMAVVRQRHELNRLARGAVITMATDRPFGDGLRNHFKRWHASIPVALVEFTRANAATIVNSVDPAIVKSFDPDRESLMAPLRNWLICYGPVFLSVPAYVGDQICASIEGVGTLKNKIDEFERKVGDVVPPLGEALRLKREILTELEKLKKQVLNKAIIEGLRAFDSVADAKTSSFYEALATEVTVDKLNAEMSKPGDQQFPIISDAAQRISMELALNADGHFNNDGFPAIHNSIILAKLALLDAEGLQKLARLAGVTASPFYKNGLYGDGTPEAQNVLFGFLRSIDGNHQWQELAPPHPRDSAIGYDGVAFKLRRDDPENFGYGYRDAGCTRVRGMRLWVDPRAREVLFKRLFKGRVVRGIDEPGLLGAGFGPALPAAYPDLYDKNDGWWRDAIEWGRSSKSIVLRLSGTRPTRARATILVPGQDDLQVQSDPSGRLDVAITVAEDILPARIELVEAGDAYSLRFAFEIGCDGRAVKFGADYAPTVIVEHGDNLWRISQRIIGDGRRYPELVAKNQDKIANPNLIYPGQVLHAPWIMPYSISLSAAK